MLIRRLHAIFIVLFFSSGIVAETPALTLKETARYTQGIFNKSAAEIIVYDHLSQTFYLVNGATPSVDILHIDADNQLVKKQSLPLGSHEQPTSVAVHDEIIAVAVHEVQASGRPGKVILFTPSAHRLAEIKVGDLPDMVTFSKDGAYILTANEGEPIGSADPEGSISVIKLDRQNLMLSSTRHINFSGLNAANLRQKGIRIAPGKTAAEDLEPEYITVSGDKAFVSLQENNAIAVIKIEQAHLQKILPLGFKDHSLPNNGLDTSDRDGGINILQHPVRGMFMPDTISSFSLDGTTYIVSANEGDGRNEDIRLGKANLDAALQQKLHQSGAGQRLKISSTDGDIDNDGDIDHAYSYGTRSFSIWDETGRLIFDSGDQFAQVASKRHGMNGFNVSNDKNGGDKRSDDKGSEPEAVAVGTIGDRTYAFIGQERTGGIMVYDVTSPARATFVHYFNDRNFDPDIDPSEGPNSLAAVGHLGLESILFIPAKQSPYGAPTLAVAYEISGSVGLYIIE